MKNSRKNSLILLLIFSLSILVAIMFFIYRENKELKVEVSLSNKQNDSIQNTLLNKNKDLITLLSKSQKEINSLKNSNSQQIDGIIHDKKPITLEELINITNKFENENNVLRTKVFNDSSRIERLNSILNQLEKDKVIDRTKKGSYTYRQITKVDSLYDNSREELSKLKTELKASNTLLKLIKDNYGIDTEVEYGKDTYTARLLNTKKIDSALWIFPYYKSKIKTNKKGETIIR
jgi:hypothetical protein